MTQRNRRKTTGKEHYMFNLVTQLYIFNTGTILTFSKYKYSFSGYFVQVHNICNALCNHKYNKPMDNVKFPTIVILITAQNHRRNITSTDSNIDPLIYFHVVFVEF